jgi:hypothetical protein
MTVADWNNLAAIIVIGLSVTIIAVAWLYFKFKSGGFK